MSNNLIAFLIALIAANNYRHIARSAKRWYFYSEGHFEVFSPEGRQVALMGVKFGMKQWTEDAKFYSHQCNDKGIGPPKLNFY